MEIKLCCCNPKCDKALLVEVNRPPQFGFELAGLANDVGWIGIIDMGKHITAVYCCEACLKTGKFTKNHIIMTKQTPETQATNSDGENDLSMNEKSIYHYLQKNTEFVSPSVIGRDLMPDYNLSSPSAWASPICKRLVKKGYLLRNERGHYKSIMGVKQLGY